MTKLSFVDRIEEVRDRRAYLKPEEIEKAIASCFQLVDRVFIQLLFRTGMRITEAISLRVSQVDFGNREITIRHLKRRGESYRRIPVDDGTLSLLQEYIPKREPKNDWLFPSPRREQHMSRFWGYKVVREAFERIGVDEVGDSLISKYRHPHPHLLRHSLGVHWMRSTEGTVENLRRLQSHLGHASMSTTSQYLDVTEEEKREDYDKLFGDRKWQDGDVEPRQ